MSQLDMSIYFYHMTGLVICFYIFIHLTSTILIKYWYNKKIRINDIDYDDSKKINNNIIFIKKILKI
uniref:ATP synthase F0 subunit 8 n=1 Tax=Apolemia rubriversa TaxID=1390100 RepID=UPI0026E1EB70|nr:ATP synthase F0 subunit 8 [Apolemia rubriversa]WJJ70040.1 ATP synthase F0 subunit 8 [Apolemia rubriversa]